MLGLTITLEVGRLRRNTPPDYKNLDHVLYAPSRSFNQTCLYTILNMPIRISVKTRSLDGGGDKARVQLANWAIAPFNRLDLLIERA